MPTLPGFSDNQFRNRADLFRAAIAVLRPLEPYKSIGGARIKIANGSGVGFDEVAAQLEGYSRPLWVVASLIKAQNVSNGSIDCNDELEGIDLQSWVNGLKSGTDPSSPEYWGDLGHFDQRSVEMETICHALLTAPTSFLSSFGHDARQNLIRWMQQINGKKIPQSNWLWFRIFVNLTLQRALGLDENTYQTVIEKEFEALDSYYLGEGWTSDGLWGDERKQADYYSGGFSIQFAQLLYVNALQKDNSNSPRVEKYKTQAREFASKFWRYFDINGILCKWQQRSRISANRQIYRCCYSIRSEYDL
jgi:hypothetical protein